jgi:hypothetical protein
MNQSKDRRHITGPGRRRRLTALLAALLGIGTITALGSSPAHAAGSEPAIHFVVDVSGSMAGDKLASAISAIQSTASAIPDTTALGLRSYSDSCDQSTVPSLVPIAVNDDAAVISAAASLSAGGGTPTTSALGRGFDELIAYPTTGTKRLVLLTDGDTQCGISICDYVKQHVPSGIQLQMYAVGLQVSDPAAQDLTCAAEYTGGSYIPAAQPSDLVDALTQAAGGSSAGPRCEGTGAEGWTFTSHVSDNDGLVLDTSSFQGRVFTKAVSAPYLVGFSAQGKKKKTTEVKIELTSDPSRAHPGVVGSALTDYKCVAFDKGDMYVRATYTVGDFLFGSIDPSPLTVTQEYRFRGEDDHPCEPSEKLACGRFWPTLSYNWAGPAKCVSTAGSPCIRFAGLQSVQRFEFRPDDKENGAIDAYWDRPFLDPTGGATVVKTKGTDGSMKYEDSDQAIRSGRRGDWDSLHQSPTDATSGPGINPFNLTPGCGECVHMHWAWGKAVNAVTLPHHLSLWTDGKPELLDGSRQDADFGIVRLADTAATRQAESDPVENGWRSLIDRPKKASGPSALRGFTPVIFWQMTSDALSDSTFPVLDNYKHGGNGAIFFGD